MTWEEFKTVYWLDDVSNKEIFSRGIDFGITQHGTVISELAYHNIKPIYCANHPIQYFDIGFRAKTINEYQMMILNCKELKISKNIINEIGVYYYMHHIFDKNDFKIIKQNGVSIKGITDRFNYNTKDLSLI